MVSFVADDTHIIPALSFDKAPTKRDDLMFDIPAELKKLPDSPGVYLMKDESEAVIYVGKALNLKNRVRQYFQPANYNSKNEAMVPKIRSFEYIVTDTEVEALILECNLIKKHWPKFNVLLKDDKSYPYIKVTLGDDFPRVMAVRSYEKDKSKYFGPYVSGFSVNEVVSLIQQIWRFRLCARKVANDEKSGRPCLNYHIGRCCAPCNGSVIFENYQKMTAEVLDFLEGKQDEITTRLEKSMFEFSENMEYEKAQEVKIKLESLKRLREHQKLDHVSGENRDVLALAREKDDALAMVFFIRGGKMIGREHFMLNNATGLGLPEILSNFITQYYSGTPFIPK